MDLLKFSQLPKISSTEVKFTDTILGRGGQGKVVKAKWNEYTVAVKIIEIHGASINSIRRELEVGQCARFPLITQILGVHLLEDKFNIIMEYIIGDSLSKILFSEQTKSSYGLTLPDKNFIVAQICSAVTYMHSKEINIIHGDIKPDNIMICNPGLTVKLSDFGYSKLVNIAKSTSISQRGPVGTTIYMAPELILEDKKNTMASDLWALGCTILEVYTGKLTWNMNDMTLRSNLRKKIMPSVDQVPYEIQDLVQGLFSYDPSNRPSADTLGRCYVDHDRSWKLK